MKGEDLENRSVQHIGQALQGQVASLNISQSFSGDLQGGAPGATPTINIRGYTGLGDMNGSSPGTLTGPLVVIDGIQGGDLSTINMSDVESISVLKDAASTAIYGSSAPFGVIIINTKKGGRDRRPTITYNNNFGFAQPINLPKPVNSVTWANIWNESSDNAGIARSFTDENIRLMQDHLDGKLPEFIAKPDERPGVDEWSGENTWNNVNWLDFYLKKRSFQQQHNVGVSGGTEKSSYYLGLGYNDQDGIYTFSDEKFKQYRMRANISTDVTNWLTVGFRGNYNRSTIDNPTNSYYSSIDETIRKWPNYALRTSDGGWFLSSRVNYIADGGRNITNNDRVALTGEFVVKPLSGWDITGNYTYNSTFRNQMIHYRTTYNPQPSGRLVASSNNPNSVYRESAKNQHQIINLFSSYEKQFGKHYFKAMVGFTQELYDNLRSSGSNNYLYSNDIPSLSLAYGTEQSVSDDASQLAIRGTFGRINYNYDQKYLIEFNGRYDGTSRFMKDVRMKFYPGVSAGWVLSREDFWQPLESYVNFMKLRVSYGQLGDQGFINSYYPFYPSLGRVAPTSNDPFNSWLFNDGRSSNITNPDLINQRLTWVTTSTIDFGTDLAFFNQKLNVSFDWYKRYADDYVGPAETLPAFLGAWQPLVNNSAMETTGIDLTIGWNDRILNNEFKYSVNLVFSDFKSKITKFPNPTGLNTTWYEGQILGDIWGYETHGLFQSQAEIDAAPSQSRFHSNWTPGDVRYVNRNGDGEIGWGDNTLDNPGDRKIIGNTAPRYSFGLTLGADYKGFDFSIFLQGVGKRDYWTSSNMFWGIHEGGTYNCSFLTHNLDRWTPETPNGYFPKYYMGGEMGKNMQVSDRYLINTAYMRIKNMQVGYTIPSNISGKINCQRARLFVNVENLATFTSFKMMDPELQTDNGRGGGKIYPLQRTWSFGLNVTF